MINTRHTILLVEDNPGDADLAAEYLADGATYAFEICHVTRLSDAFKVLGAKPVDAVLLDLNLPDSSGLDTFIQLRPAARGAPIIVLAGRVDDSFLQQLLAAPVEISIWNGTEERHCEIRIVPFEWQGEPTYLGSIRDLTELKRSQAEAIKKEQLAQHRARLLRRLLDDITQVATKYGLTDVRDATALVLGTPNTEILSEEIIANVPPPSIMHFVGMSRQTQI